MLCVIIGHLGTPGISAFVYTFHMPLFFYLSGFLFHHQNNISHFLLRKTKSLIIPYFCLAIPVFFNELFLNHGVSFQMNDLWLEFLRLLFQKRYTNLWFIASLFFANCFLFLLCKFIRISSWKFIGAILLSLSVYFYWKKGGSPLPWNMDVSLFVLPFMVVAIIMHDNKILTNIIVKHKDKYFVLFLLSNIAFGGINYYLTGERFDLYYSSVNYILLAYIAAFCGIIWILILSNYAFIRIINYIGNNSLLIFAWHLVIKNCLERLYDIFNIFQPPLPLFVVLIRDVTSLVLILLILIPLNELILHSKLKFILGK